jgi:hypothetical protein
VSYDAGRHPVVLFDDTFGSDVTDALRFHCCVVNKADLGIYCLAYLTNRGGMGHIIESDLLATNWCVNLETETHPSPQSRRV